MVGKLAAKAKIARRNSFPVGGSSKGDFRGSSKGDTGKRVIPQYFWPNVGWLARRLRDHPKLAERVVDQGDASAFGGRQGPTAAQKVDLMVGVDPAA